LSGPAVSLSDAANLITQFTAPDVVSTSEIIFELTVVDNDGATVSDAVTIQINPMASQYCASSSTELQAALDAAAVDGRDSVVGITVGTYSGPFDYSPTTENSLSVIGGFSAGCASKALASENTILDGNATSNVIAFTTDSLIEILSIEDLVITNGYIRNVYADAPVRYGIGLFIKNPWGDVRISGVMVTENVHDARDQGYASGVGAYIKSENLTITDSSFENNRSIVSQSAGGEGIALFAEAGLIGRGTFSLIDNLIKGQSGGRDAGTSGVYAAYYSSYLIEGNTFDSNAGIGEHCPALYLYGASDPAYVSVQKNTFSNNIGGALKPFGSGSFDVEISQNYFLANTGGAALQQHNYGTTDIEGNLFVANSTPSSGGAITGTIYYGYTKTFVTNNTFVNNSAVVSGGGVHLGVFENAGTLVVSNNAFFGNSGTEGADFTLNPDENADFIPGNVTVENNAMDSANSYLSSPYIPDIETVTPSANDFTDFVNGEFGPSPTSSLIDAGDNNFVTVPVDFHGNARIINSIVDIGAIEYSP
jgi:hypothetical protein